MKSILITVVCVVLALSMLSLAQTGKPNSYTRLMEYMRDSYRIRLPTSSPKPFSCRPSNSQTNQRQTLRVSSLPKRLADPYTDQLLPRDIWRQAAQW